MKPKEKKRRLSILIITSSILVILLTIFALILINRRTEAQGAWYNASWLYRRPITVTGNGTSQTNFQIMVIINTSTLVTEGKLQSNCNDLRFTDSNETTLITHWIEGGCNTSHTRVWVLIPSLGASGSTIYVYYGNSSIGSGELSWTGNFILLADAACPSGWTRNTSFDSRFPYGASSYGTTGGSSASHNHNSPVTATTGNPNLLIMTDCGGLAYTASATHKHTAPVTIGSTTFLPPYINMFFCDSSRIDSFTGLISLFDTGTLTSDWTRFTALDNRFPRGASAYGTTGGTTTHTHTASAGTLSVQNAMQSVNFGTSANTHINARYDHTHTGVSTSCGTGTHTPPYLVMVFGKWAGSAGTYSDQFIAMGTAIPPLGYDRFTNLDNRFPYGGSTPGGTGGSSTHSHSVTLSATGAASYSEYRQQASGCNVSRGDHAHSTGTIAITASNLPAYLTTYYLKRKSIGFGSSVGTEQTSNAIPNDPDNLRVNNVVNNFNVNTGVAINFTARFSDPDTSDTGVYYELHVNTNSNFSGTVMWNSGQIAIGPITNGNQSPNIAYAGSALSSGTQYWWRIRFWDNKGGISNWSSNSLVAYFMTQRQPYAPTDLLTDGLTNPSGILSLTPSFSAIYTDANLHSATYYEINVNSNSSFTGTVMWNSGKTATNITNANRSPNYTYAGTALTGTSGTTYYWRIRFWDADNLTGDWSATATFVDSLNHQYFQGLQMTGLQLN